MGEKRFYINVQDNDDTGKAIANFLTLNSRSRTKVLTKIIAAVLGPEGIQYYKNCTDSHESAIYKYMLIQKLDQNSGDSIFLRAVQSSFKNVKQKEEVNAKEKEEKPELSESDESLLEEEPVLSVEEKESARNLLNFFSDGQ